MKHNSVILVFIDGLGIGARGRSNPFEGLGDVDPIAHFSESRRKCFMDGIVVPTDPRLGVEGRPQSASGQTTILTGINAPAALGYHKQGFPNERLRSIISEHSIFLQLRNAGVLPNVFVNAYSPRFFAEIPRWKSATTCAVEAAGMQFRTFSDLLAQRALYHDFTNSSLVESGFDIPSVSSSAAASTLAKFTNPYRFILYEHFMTDKIGHDRDVEAARRHLPLLAEFVRALLEFVDLESTTVILTSDHGNIEDLSVRNHTLNDVPTILWGRNADSVAPDIRDLTDITPAILRLLTE
ncbi:MAG: hypothetical protein WBD22_03570 [Pyrinomonadaceae bacterium]